MVNILIVGGGCFIWIYLDLPLVAFFGGKKGVWGHFYGSLGAF